MSTAEVLTICRPDPWITAHHPEQIAGDGMNVGELKETLQDLLQMKDKMTAAFAMTTQAETAEDQQADRTMLEWAELVNSPNINY
jgi:hypothetical protein